MENKGNKNLKKGKESIYKSQIKHLRNNYKRFALDFKIDEFNKFKDICSSNGTTPTFVIKSFVKSYIDKNGKWV